jgi:hypothetical protein
MTTNPWQGQPQGQWQPRYDPATHTQRLDQGGAPQGYGQRQWSQQPPQQQWPQYPPPGHRPPPRKRATGKIIAAIIGGLVLLVIAVAAASHAGKTASPASSASVPAFSAPAAAAPAKPAAAGTVEFVVTGSPAQVTYGPAGTSVNGKVPMHDKHPLGNPLYYSISAQLNGGGQVTCEIKVNGTVISQAVASGGYNIAMCEVSKDPVSGQWTATMGA